jgi:hypothetical protein
MIRTHGSSSIIADSGRLPVDGAPSNEGSGSGMWISIVQVPYWGDHQHSAAKVSPKT